MNYVAKFPNWSVAGCHGNRIKNPAPWFCAQYTHSSSTQVWLACNIVELRLLQFLAKKRLCIVTMATDQNNTHLLKRHDLSSMMIYNTMGQILSNIDKIHVKNGGQSSYTPLSWAPGGPWLPVFRGAKWY